jgi:hypothetical protein
MTRSTLAETTSESLNLQSRLKPYFLHQAHLLKCGHHLLLPLQKLKAETKNSWASSSSCKPR